MTKFIIIGNGNAVAYKEIFPLIKENNLWLGNKCFSGGMDFVAGENYDSSKCKHPKYDDEGNIIINVMMCVWFTNIEHNKRHAPLDLYKKYSSESYPKYDNYDAIESRTDEIPMDYDGVMGVPITFLDKYCPEQFEIVGMMSGAKGEGLTNGNDGRAKFYVNDKGVYARILIKRKKYEKKFIIIGSDNARTYKETFPLLKENKMWIGINHIKGFVQPDNTIKSFGNISWFTNMEHSRRNKPLDLYKKYNPTDYPKYQNYDAIEVSKVTDIPMDYYKTIGVPITFLDMYCPTQFEIIGCADADIVPQGWNGMTKEFVDLYYAQGNTGSYKEGNRLACFIHNGKAKVPFKRILIKRK